MKGHCCVFGRAFVPRRVRQLGPRVCEAEMWVLLSPLNFSKRVTRVITLGGDAGNESREALYYISKFNSIRLCLRSNKYTTAIHNQAGEMA